MNIERDEATAFIEVHQPEVYRLAYSLVLDVAAAEQLVQNALLAALRGSTGRLPANIWLARWVIDACRRRETAQAVKDWAADTWQRLRSAENNDGPAESGASADAGSGIWPAYQRLDGDGRRVIALRYFHGYTVEKVAALLRVGPPAVRARLRAAREKLEGAAGGPNDMLGEYSAGGINHTQARHMMQTAADLPLSGPEWLVLQGHLDACPACRAYRSRVQLLERELGRALQGHLAPPQGSSPEAADRVLRAWDQSRRRARGVSLLVLLLGLLVGGYLLLHLLPGVNGSPLAAVTATPSPWPTPQRTRTPTLPDLPGAEIFRSPVLFESTRGGASELFLLLPGENGGELANLTNHPAVDTAPAWSPDGEWIAFISDRSGKPEVYTLHISGSPTVQITNAPEVTWQGPLAWSPDGQMLAAAGRWLADDNHTWLYLIRPGESPAQGAGPTRLSDTRNARSPQWSPAGGWLAYEQTLGGRVGVYARQVENEWFQSFSWLDATRPGFFYQAASSSFTWAPDHLALLHVLEGPYIDTNSSGRPADDFTTRLILNGGLPGSDSLLAQQFQANFPLPERLKSLSWSPAGLQAMLVRSNDARTARCWTLRVLNPNNSYTAFSDVRDLCVAAPLDGQPWSEDGRWLVVGGHTPQDEGRDSLFAIDLGYLLAGGSPAVLAASEQPRLVRLSPPASLDANPQVRPQGAMLGIQPQPVRTEAIDGSPPPVDLATAPGTLYQTIASDVYPGASFPEIFSQRLDGAQLRNLTNHLAPDLSPVVSPDGRRVAFFSNRNASSSDPSALSAELYTMNSDGSGLSVLTDTPRSFTAFRPPDANPNTYPFYKLPAWSPDGERLAVLVAMNNSISLAIFPADPRGRGSRELGTTPRLVDEGELVLGWGQYSRLVWLPDGQSLLLAQSTEQGTRLLRASVINYGLPARDWKTDVLWSTGPEDRIDDLALSPDGRQVAVLVTRGDRVDSSTNPVDLLLFNSSGTDQTALLLAHFAQGAASRYPTQVSWSPAGLLVRYHGPSNEHYKSFIDLIDSTSGARLTLFSSEDRIRRHWLSPEANWLLYASDTGLWALELSGVIARHSLPARVSAETSMDLDWGP